MAIYDEAVVDAQKLRLVAEEAAKQQILEAITPRIRKMINSRILSEQAAPEDQDDIDLSDEDQEGLGLDQEEEIEDTDDTEDLEDEEFDDSDDYDIDFSSLGDISSTNEPVSTVSAPSAAPAADSKGSSFVINNTGDIHIKSESHKRDKTANSSLVETLSNTVVPSSYGKIISTRVDALSNKIIKFKLVLEALSHVKATPAQKRQIRDTYHKLMNEAISLRSEVFAGGGGSQRLERKLISTLKEMKVMSSKTKRNIFDFLFEGESEDKKLVSRKNSKRLFEADEGEDKKDEPDFETDMGGDEGGEDKTDKVKDALSSLLSALEMDDLEVTKKDDSEADTADVGGDEELDLGEAYEEGSMDEMYEEGMDEAVDEELDEAADEELDEASDEEDAMDEVFEISESDLRKELSKMKKLRESKVRNQRAARAKTLREEADPKADQFGGGEVFGDVFEMSEDELINVLVDELGSVKQMPKPAKAHESIAVRKAMQEAAQYKKAAEALKAQLVEMNLFNAKLLYSNKLMQNKDLTLKQQRAIVEALDNAKTLNEAKLLYKSLSESLARRGQQSGNLRESASRTLGSSSRSTRSAQPASNGVEVDRWAVLAGLPEGK